MNWLARPGLRRPKMSFCPAAGAIKGLFADTTRAMIRMGKPVAATLFFSEHFERSGDGARQEQRGRYADQGRFNALVVGNKPNRRGDGERRESGDRDPILEISWH